FFCQAEDGIRDRNVTGVQTCALPILFFPLLSLWADCLLVCLVLAAVRRAGVQFQLFHGAILVGVYLVLAICGSLQVAGRDFIYKIGRASCRGRVEMREVERT